MASKNRVAQFDYEADQEQASVVTGIMNQSQNKGETGSIDELIDEVSGAGDSETYSAGEELTEAEEADNHQPMSYTSIPNVKDKDGEDDESGETTESEFETAEGWDESSLTEAGTEEGEALIEASYADAESADGGQEIFGAILAVLAPIAKTVLPMLAKTTVQSLAGAAVKQGAGNASKLAARHRNLFARLSMLGMPKIGAAANLLKGRETQEFDEAAEVDEATLDQLERQIETLEVVIGKDDRVRISNTKVNPWNRICHLSIKTATGKRYLGTGFLIGPRTIITAGHCVYIHSQGGWPQEIIVTPGRNGSEAPFSSFTATSFRSVKGWVKNKSRNYDYGAIILPKNVVLPPTIGAFGFASYTDQSLRNNKLNTAGYPGDKPTGTMWFHGRKAKSVTSRTIVYDIDTAGGQSGSAVWVNKNNKRVVVGIHTNGLSTGNSATRITKPVFNNLKKWRDEGK